MKTRVTSNFRPLLRAFYPSFMAIAVPWAVPRNAHAQVYVTQVLLESNAGFVSKYDVDTGHVINASFITGLTFPTGLAVSDKDNTLFVASGLGNGTIGKYDATTGAPIDTNFITGLNAPLGLALSDNNLFDTAS